jgi:hypothetical protein
MKIKTKEKGLDQNNNLIEIAAEQWIGLLLAQLRNKNLRKKSKQNKANYASTIA